MKCEITFGISTGCFFQTPIEQVLHYFEENDFRRLEICSFPAHLDFHDEARIRSASRVLETSGLEAVSFHAPFADHIDISSWNEGIRHRSVEELRLACRAAKAMGVKYIVLHPGPEKEGHLRPHEWYSKMQLAADSLNEIANYCTELDIVLLLENMLPHLMFGNTSDMLFLLGAVRSVNLGTCLDTGHAHLSGDLPRVANKLSGHLRMIHANDNNGKWDDHLPPGKGQIQWARLIDQLHEVRFCGLIVLELSGSGTPEEILRGASEGREYLRRLIRKREETEVGSS